ncbi:MAG: hypothetical protein IT324_08975 [Anaerolineae bacterium]|nr:hypothetical protein [Anaerolineae bacterium]
MAMVMLLGREACTGNLTQELKALLRCQITILVAIWLVFAAPLTCQYHGLLPLVMGSSHHNHTLPDSTADSDHALRSHAPASSVTLSLFIVVLPGNLSVQLPESPSEQLTLAPIALYKWIAPPPDNPPRRVI